MKPTTLHELFSIPDEHLPAIWSCQRAQRLLEGRKASKNARNLDLEPDDPSLQLTDDERIAALNDPRAFLTYGQIIQKANQFARFLLSEGVKKGQRVVLLLPRSVDLTICELACSKIGAIFVPVDPENATRRIVAILRDVIPSYVISLSGELNCREVFSSYPVLLLDKKRELLSRQLESAPDVLVTPQDSAYILYTSGTTQNPRGVEVTHEGFAYWFYRQREIVPYPGDIGTVRFAGFSSSGFDPHIWELLVAASLNASVVPVPPLVRHDPSQLASFLREMRITDALFLPTVLRPLIPLIDSPKKLALRRVYSTGEKLPWDIVLACQSLLGNGDSEGIYDAYGPSEMTIGASIRKRQLSDFRTRLPDGSLVPVKNVDSGATSYSPIYVRGQEESPIRFIVDPSVGAPGQGELLIVSPYIMKGYWRSPKETAEKVVSLPDGTRAFKTGDIVFEDPEGRIYFSERESKSFVKVCGEKVTPSETAAHLRSHEQIEDAAVVPVEYTEDIQGEMRTGFLFHAFLVLKGSSLPVHLRAFLSKLVSPKAVPQNFSVRRSMPITLNGKTDFNALCEEAKSFYRSAKAEVSSVYKKTVCALPNIEDRIARIWQHVLPKLGAMSDVDSFLYMGGDSLRFAQMIAELRKDFDIEIPYFESDFPSREQLTIKTLAAFLYPRLCAKEDAEGRSNVHLVSEGEAGERPFFLLHPITGEASSTYEKLIRNLQQKYPHRPIYVLNARARYSNMMDCALMDLIVSDYARSIERIQKEGPYDMIGWSAGCALVHRIAAKLQSKGKALGFLALLDGIAPNVYQAMSVQLFFKHLSLLLSKLVQVLSIDASCLAQSLDDDLSQYSSKENLVRGMFEKVQKTTTDEPSLRTLRITQHMLLASLSVEDHPYIDSSLHVYQTEETKNLIENGGYSQDYRALGWEKGAREVCFDGAKCYGIGHVDIIDESSFRLVGEFPDSVLILSPKQVFQTPHLAPCQGGMELLNKEASSLMESDPVKAKNLVAKQFHSDFSDNLVGLMKHVETLFTKNPDAACYYVALQLGLEEEASIKVSGLPALARSPIYGARGSAGLSSPSGSVATIS